MTRGFARSDESAGDRLDGGTERFGVERPIVIELEARGHLIHVPQAT